MEHIDALLSLHLEDYSLCKDLCTICQIDTIPVFKQWGLTLIRAGLYDTARSRPLVITFTPYSISLTHRLYIFLISCVNTPPNFFVNFIPNSLLYVNRQKFDVCFRDSSKHLHPSLLEDILTHIQLTCLRPCYDASEFCAATILFFT
jgi:hypothetical protein